MSEITPEQSEAYIDEGGVFCPLCKSETVQTSDSAIEIASSGAYQDCYCSHCKATWTDCYSLIAAESVDD